jgi:phosphoserine aminotransferase
MLELKKHGSCWNYISYRKKKFASQVEVIPSILIMKAYQSRKYNTPAVFPVYASLTLQWLKNLGGVVVIEN